jgi:hypothetical protein
MPSRRLTVLGAAAFLASIVSLPAIDVAAQDTTPLPAGRDTLKQRLGHKWSDAQRVNDCKVPPERRGESKRPSECAPRRTVVSQPRAP